MVILIVIPITICWIAAVMDLHERGVITAGEFNARRADLAQAA